MTVLEKCDRLPPFVCRLLARKNRGRAGLSHDELAQRSGLPKSTVADLSVRKTWRGVPIEVVDSFALACGVNHLQASRQVKFFRRRQKTYIFKAPPAQRALYAKLFRLLDEWVKSKQASVQTGSLLD